MKKIFVYGILQKDISAKHFGIRDDYYVGRAKLHGFWRNSLTAIFNRGNKEDVVEGDIFEVPDDIEEKLFRFEHQYGYHREITKPIRISDGKTFETISYLLPQR